MAKKPSKLARLKRAAKRNTSPLGKAAATINLKNAEQMQKFEVVQRVDDIGEGLAWVTTHVDASKQAANPKQAYGDAKVALQLVPPVVEVLAAVAFKEGAIKYGPYNYRETPVEIMTYIGAIKRHVSALLDGEDIDPDSILGKSHLAGIIASAGIIADCQENGNLIDNRPKKGTGTALLKKWEKKV